MSHYPLILSVDRQGLTMTKSTAFQPQCFARRRNGTSMSVTVEIVGKERPGEQVCHASAKKL